MESKALESGSLRLVKPFEGSFKGSSNERSKNLNVQRSLTWLCELIRGVPDLGGSERASEQTNWAASNSETAPLAERIGRAAEGWIDWS